LNVREAVGAACARIEAGDPAIWISRVARDVAEARAEEVSRTRADAPLAGLTFAVKDNIDVAGMPTTAGCPDFAYTPAESATAVARLEAAGAVLLGKTNLDQFATGLVGTRSPYGVPQNPIEPRFVPGGSSSGSAVAVARGMVSFALGTDTAGSGRVPAATRIRGYRRAFQNVVHRVADIGWTPAEIDYAPLREAAQLRYSGPWVAERLVALTPFIDGRPESVLPVTRRIIVRGREYSAADYFRAVYRLEELGASAATADCTRRRCVPSDDRGQQAPVAATDTGRRRAGARCRR